MACAERCAGSLELDHCSTANCPLHDNSSKDSARVLYSTAEIFLPAFYTSYFKVYSGKTDEHLYMNDSLGDSMRVSVN